MLSLLNSLVRYTTATFCDYDNRWYTTILTFQPEYLGLKKKKKKSNLISPNGKLEAKGTNRKLVSVTNCLHHPRKQSLVGSALNTTEYLSNQGSYSKKKSSL